nr:alpha/beta fold hydrolase [Streptomyces sp. HNM0574]
MRHAGTVLTDHTFPVPLDHSAPDGEQIELYAREVVAAGREGDELPWLVYLQGGPGGRSPRPLGPSWLEPALRHYRVLLLDQRGTGRSTPASRQTLPLRGTAAQQADYLAHFRADSIVRDAELVRKRLLGEDTPWSVLGQSFGGMCTFTYLSYAPEGLREAFVTGGIPGLRVPAEDVYRRTYPTVARKNAAHYARYPGDVAAVRAVAGHLRAAEEAGEPVRLPDGSPLTVARFQSLGLMLGGGSGSDTLHYLLEDAWVTGGVPGSPRAELSDTFLAAVHTAVSLAPNPLFAVLHEASYGQRSVSRAGTGWAAQRVRPEFPEFDAAAALDGDRPVYFTGEMIYPWHFEADPALRPLAETARLLAEREDWPDLYDPARLAANTVPVQAAVYHDDMYVDRENSLATAAAVGNVRTWITNEWEHDGLRLSEGRVLERLLAMGRGEV